jgi:hypothetical protein
MLDIEVAYEQHVDSRNVFPQSSSVMHRMMSRNCAEENIERIVIEWQKKLSKRLEIIRGSMLNLEATVNRKAEGARDLQEAREGTFSFIEIGAHHQLNQWCRW